MSKNASDIKALSVDVGYALYIAGGLKKIEYRSWPTRYRGELLICSTKYKDPAWQGKLPLGMTIAIVDLTDCIYNASDDVYEWHLANPRPVKLQPVKGQQRIYTPKLEKPVEVLNVKGDDEYYDYLTSQGFLLFD